MQRFSSSNSLPSPDRPSVSRNSGTNLSTVTAVAALTTLLFAFREQIEQSFALNQSPHQRAVIARAENAVPFSSFKPGESLVGRTITIDQHVIRIERQDLSDELVITVDGITYRNTDTIAWLGGVQPSQAIASITAAANGRWRIDAPEYGTADIDHAEICKAVSQLRAANPSCQDQAEVRITAALAPKPGTLCASLFAASSMLYRDNKRPLNVHLEQTQRIQAVAQNAPR